MGNFRRWLRFNYLKLRRVKDEPEKLAKGIALGLAGDFLPIPFIGVVVAYLVSPWLKANRIAAVITALFFKPGFIFFVTLNYLTGKLLFGEVPQSTQVPIPAEADLMALKWDVFQKMGTAYFLGGIINFLLVGLIGYTIARRLTHRWHARRKLRRKARHAERDLVAISKEPGGTSPEN